MTASAESQGQLGAPDIAPPPVFVVGYPRSGTSLMRSLIGSHPQIAMLRFETHLLTRWRRRYGMVLSDPETLSDFWSALTATGHYEPEHVERIGRCIDGRKSVSMLDVLECVLATHAASQGSVRPGEKTPDHYKHIELLLSRFPGCQIVFMIRDPRAVLASWRDSHRAWTDKRPEAIVHNWRRSVYELERWVAHDAVLVVRYEDLAVEPDKEVARVISFLGLPVHEGILEREGSGRLHGKYDVHGPVATGSIERWHDVLSDDQVAWVENEVWAEMRRYGYEPSRSVSMLTKIRSTAKRLYFKFRYLLGRAHRQLNQDSVQR